jgi:hypothetical protein
MISVLNSQDQEPARAILIRMPLQLLKRSRKRSDTATADSISERTQKSIFLLSLQGQGPRKRNVQWQRNAEFVLQQTVNVILFGTLPLPLFPRLVFSAANELGKDFGLVGRRTPSAASAILSSRGAEECKVLRFKRNVGFTYIRGRRAWASCQRHEALPVSDHRAAMDRLVCLCVRWTSIDRGRTGAEEAGWKASLRPCASLLEGHQCNPAACLLGHPHPRLLSPSIQPEASLFRAAKVPWSAFACRQ